MGARVKSFSVEGINGYPIEIEVSSVAGVPNITIVGLGDQAIKESADRILSSMLQYGYKLPQARVIVNLAPCDMKKRGSHYDLGMAICLLQHSEQIKAPGLGRYAFIGELSLGGELRPCSGILPMIIEAKLEGITDVIIPYDNYAEAVAIKDINIIPMRSLGDVVQFLETGEVWDICAAPESAAGPPKSKGDLDFADVKGQDDIIAAVTLAVAGNHNILLSGPPGCGKTMIAQRIPGIMPEMTEAEALDVTKILSIAGEMKAGSGLVRVRPFRAPHHNASLNALIGGGNPSKPGEVTLAHNGVLFLDEFPEFSRAAIEALRLPLENKKVTIARVSSTNTYPADFLLVAAMNPCPCGYYPAKRCNCTDYEVKRYRGKLSGPILDRIDIQKNMKEFDYFAAPQATGRYNSTMLRDKVKAARDIQARRFKDYEGISCNAQMTAPMVSEFCKLDPASEALFEESCKKYGYSARTIERLLRMARTSADLAGSESIRRIDVEFVLSCRDLDKSNSELYVV